MKLIKSAKIRIAIVGCGRISKNHFDSIKSNEEFIQLVSICDVNEKVLLQNEEIYKVNGYIDLKEMLSNEDLDLVAICTPSGLHSKQTKICASYGVNIITEKPMATTWQVGLSMVKACDDANVG